MLSAMIFQANSTALAATTRLFATDLFGFDGFFFGWGFYWGSGAGRRAGR